jgi:hypothetical protein
MELKEINELQNLDMVLGGNVAHASGFTANTSPSLQQHSMYSLMYTQ